MDESFDIPVIYKGEELSFSARLLQLGYTYKIQVHIYDQEVFFEPDEERNFRAIIDPDKLGFDKRIEVDLLKAIAEAIEAIVK